MFNVPMFPKVHPLNVVAGGFICCMTLVLVVVVVVFTASCTSICCAAIDRALFSSSSSSSLHNMSRKLMSLPGGFAAFFGSVGVELGVNGTKAFSSSRMLLFLGSKAWYWTGVFAGGMSGGGAICGAWGVGVGGAGKKAAFNTGAAAGSCLFTAISFCACSNFSW